MSVADEPVDHSKFWTWERVIGIVAVVQLVLIVAVAVYFAWVTNQQNHILAENTIAQITAARKQSEANHQVLLTLTHDIALHARGSADRSCASTKMVAYLVKLSPDITSHVSNRVDGFVKQACTLIPIPRVVSTG